MFKSVKHLRTFFGGPKAIPLPKLQRNGSGHQIEQLAACVGGPVASPHAVMMPFIRGTRDPQLSTQATTQHLAYKNLCILCVHKYIHIYIYCVCAQVCKHSVRIDMIYIYIHLCICILVCICVCVCKYVSVQI